MPSIEIFCSLCRGHSLNGLMVAALLVGSFASSQAADRLAQASAGGAGFWADFVETNFPFFSSVLDARHLGPGWPTNNLTPRGLILNLGHGAWACFDTDLLRVSAVWTTTGTAPLTPVSMSQGSYHTKGVKAREGQDNLPQMKGTPWMASGNHAGWQSGNEIDFTDPREPAPDTAEVGRGPLAHESGRFKAIHLNSVGARLEYEVAGVAVSEWIEARIENNQRTVQRRFQLDAIPRPLWLVLGQRPTNVAGRLNFALTNWTDGLLPSTGNAPVVQLRSRPDGWHAARLQPSALPLEFAVAMALDGEARARAGPSSSASAAMRWPQPVTTRGTLSAGTNVYVLDPIGLPTDNPWHRNVRLADVAFLGGGRAAAVSFDGDVWQIAGLEGDLSRVTWRRFASGLHEPLSLVARGGELFVNDRNGIWRLRDTDGNGEADVHELFCNAFTQTAETREFATSMKLAPDGSFVIAKGGQQSSTVGRHNGTILRIAPDGGTVTELAWGLRMPFIGVHPRTGLVSASDQQGHYVPATPLYFIRDHEYYGFIPLIRPKEQYPAPIAEPLTWIPHAINPSGVCQTWLVGARMGPLNDAFIHLGYYRPEIFVVRLNDRGTNAQAAVISLTRQLEFPPLSGTVNPTDGQLYVAGFQIWGTEAKLVSGLARLRYTGAPNILPREVAAMKEGVLLRFDVPLDPRRATDPASFSADQWNYQRTASYGSPHFRLDGSKGQDSLRPASAYLSKDGRSVFVGLPDMRPAMQMRIGWALATMDGATFEQNAYFTPRELTPFDPVREGFAPLVVNLQPGDMAAPARTPTPVTVEEGRRVSELMGCVACHSTDGTTDGKIGPTWKGLFGSTREFADGKKAVADEAYLRESIREPAARVVTGFEANTGMPSYEGVITDAQIEALVLYLKSLH